MGFNPFKIFKSLRISQEGTLTPKVIDIIPGGTAGTTTTVQSSQTANRTVTLPDATGTIVLKDSTDTLTNKTIDADGTGNSIINIENADIKTGAAIALNKLAALTASKAAITDGSGVLITSTTTAAEIAFVNGVTSAIQTQIDAKANLTLNNIVPSVNVDFNAKRIINVADPVNPQDVATKAYVSTAGTGANTTLSNLTNTIAIPNGVDLLPATDTGINIGSSSKRINDITVNTTHTDSVTNVSGGNAISVSGRALRDSGNNDSVDWGNRQLKTATVAFVDWSGSNVSLNSHKLTNVTDPTSAQDAATKAYVDLFRNASVNVARSSTGAAFTSRTIQIFNSALWDDFGSSYNTSTGIFTAPKTGKYQVAISIVSSNITLATNQSFSSYVVDNSNNTLSGNGNLTNFVYGNGVGRSNYLTSSHIVSLSTSAQIAVSAASDISTSLATTSNITITYLGT